MMQGIAAQRLNDFPRVTQSGFTVTLLSSVNLHKRCAMTCQVVTFPRLSHEEHCLNPEVL